MTSKDKARKENSKTCSVTSSALKTEAIDPSCRQGSATLQQLPYRAGIDHTGKNHRSSRWMLQTAELSLTPLRISSSKGLLRSVTGLITQVRKNKVANKLSVCLVDEEITSREP